MEGQGESKPAGELKGQPREGPEGSKKLTEEALESIHQGISRYLKVSQGISRVKNNIQSFASGKTNELISWDSYT